MKEVNISLVNFNANTGFHTMDVTIITSTLLFDDYENSLWFMVHFL